MHLSCVLGACGHSPSRSPKNLAKVFWRLENWRTWRRWRKGGEFGDCQGVWAGRGPWGSHSCWNRIRPLSSDHSDGSIHCWFASVFGFSVGLGLCCLYGARPISWQVPNRVDGTSCSFTLYRNYCSRPCSALVMMPLNGGTVSVETAAEKYRLGDL